MGVRLSQGDLAVRSEIKCRCQEPKRWLLHLYFHALADGELEEAVTHFATAYELNPELKQAIRISTEISIRRGDYEGADAAYHIRKQFRLAFPRIISAHVLSLKSPMETSLAPG